MRSEKWPTVLPEPDLAHARVSIGRGCGMQANPPPPNDLFEGLAEVIEYIRQIENRIIELESKAGNQLVAD